MILTVTLNAAVDLTYRVGALAVHGTNRILEVRQRAGGKGINVARVLQALGHDTMVTGLAGGGTGEEIRADLRVAGLSDELVQIAGGSRRTVAVVDGHDATVLNEPGPSVTRAEWARFLARFRPLVARSQAVVLSGSLPRGVPGDAYAQLTEAAAGVPVLLDCAGVPLLAGLAASPTLIKPNGRELDEISRTYGFAAMEDPGDPAEVIETADAIRLRGGCAVVVSCGAMGLVAATGEGRWRVAAPEILSGNPTGAGDAAVAALAVGIASGANWPELLADAVALSAAAVLAPVAGSFDHDAYVRFRRAVSAVAG